MSTPASEIHASVLSDVGRRREEATARPVGTAAAPELPVRGRLRFRLRHEFAGRQAIPGCRQTHSLQMLLINQIGLADLVIGFVLAKMNAVE